MTFIHRVLQIPPYHQTLVSGNEFESYRVSQIARLLSFNEYQTLVSGNESDSFIAFHKSLVCCCSMNSESFRGQPLLFHAPPPAPAFTFIYCAVNVNAPADFMKMVPTSPMFYIPSSSSSCVLAFGLPFADGWPAGGRRAGVRACRGRH